MACLVGGLLAEAPVVRQGLVPSLCKVVDAAAAAVGASDPRIQFERAIEVGERPIKVVLAAIGGVQPPEDFAVSRQGPGVVRLQHQQAG